MSDMIMGIDPSIRSTGICIWNESDNSHNYAIISQKPTKRLASANIKNFEVIKYDYISGGKGIEAEHHKTNNVVEITDRIEELIMRYGPRYIVIEAVAFQASGTIDQLAGLNYCIRMICMKHNIPIYAVSPSSVKLRFVGNGQATKDMMIETWSQLEPIADQLINFKCDDLADAYALAHYPAHLYV